MSVIFINQQVSFSQRYFNELVPVNMETRLSTQNVMVSSSQGAGTLLVS